MKFYFTLPKNEEFFNSYATLTPTLLKLGYFAQVISGLTEIGVIYSLVYSSLKEFIPAQASLFAILGAFVGTAFLEIGLRKFVPYSFRAILYKRYQGLHLVMSIAIFSVALGLAFASGLLSFKGSKEIVEAVAPAPKLESFSETEAYFQSEAQAIQASHSSQIAAIKNQYSTLVEVEKLKLENYQKKEVETGKKYTTRIAALSGRIAELQAQQAQEIAKLEASKAERIAEAQGRRSQGRQRVDQNNQTAKLEAQQKTGKYSFGLAYFTLFCLLVFIASVGLNEVHLKGAEIEEKPLPTQYHFSQPILSDFWEMLFEKLNYHSRSMIARLADKTPEPTFPAKSPVLYEYSPQIERRQIGFQIPTKQESPSVNSATIIAQAQPSCQNCGKNYTPKVSWQKFCSTDCKEAFHTAKHGGTPFNPSKYNKNKK